MADPTGVVKRPRRLAPLDGLRLVAALTVVFYHYIGQGTRAWGADTSHLFPRAHPIVSYGWTGVQLFFLISGFVICMSGWGRTVGDFAVSRVVRLYPAYIAGVLLTSAVITALPLVTERPTPGRVLVNLTMLQEAFGVQHIDSVYWTLWAELRFYLVFSLLVWCGLTYRRAVLFCVLGVAATILADHSDNRWVLMVVQPENLPFFIGGIAIYLMYRFGANALLWAIVAACYVLGQRQMIDRLDVMADATGAHGSAWVAGGLLLAFYLLIIAVAFGAFSWANWGWLTAAGGLTYPLYLLHEYIGWTLIKRFQQALPRQVLLLAVVTGMLALSWLVHRMIERPLAPRLKRWLKGVLHAFRRDHAERTALPGQPAAPGQATAPGQPTAPGQAPLPQRQPAAPRIARQRSPIAARTGAPGVGCLTAPAPAEHSAG
ncbi:acyltransferase family protein [Planosporangium thailandense]|uniref:Acyltransferase family protein n=1 Tax=Planosporangium thailandense TaxID=765197 RepID=A0ABX0XQN0_9ACTN|nr:acyltransferase family protein [Planosporangium thailandense]